jgi:hypothetical protein
MESGFVLYHVTSARAASEILNGGFIDGEGSYMNPGSILNGVFLSNRALLGPFPRGVALEVCFSIPLDRLDEFEMVDEELEYREWCVPAILIKRSAMVRLDEFVVLEDFLDPTIDREVEIARLRVVKIQGNDTPGNVASAETDGNANSERPPGIVMTLFPTRYGY